MATSDTPLAVDAEQAVAVIRTNAAERRQMSQQIRHTLSVEMQAELEARIAAMIAQEKQLYERQRDADQARWHAIEEQWSAREAQLASERERLALERDRAVQDLQQTKSMKYY